MVLVLVFAGMKFVQSAKRVNLIAAISVRGCELRKWLGDCFRVSFTQSSPEALKCGDKSWSPVGFQHLKSHLPLLLPAVLKGQCASDVLAPS